MDLWGAITQRIRDTIAAGGRIRFNLNGFNPAEALDPASANYNSWSERSEASTLGPVAFIDASLRSA